MLTIQVDKYRQTCKHSYCGRGTAMLTIQEDTTDMQTQLCSPYRWTHTDRHANTAMLTIQEDIQTDMQTQLCSPYRWTYRQTCKHSYAHHTGGHIQTDMQTQLCSPYRWTHTDRYAKTAMVRHSYAHQTGGHIQTDMQTQLCSTDGHIQTDMQTQLCSTYRWTHTDRHASTAMLTYAGSRPCQSTGTCPDPASLRQVSFRLPGRLTKLSS